MKNFIKKIIKIASGIPTYYFRSYFQIKAINKFDSTSPIEGKIASDGWSSYEISKKSIQLLKELNNLNRKIHFDNRFKFLIEELFTKISDDMIDYIGKDIRLDGLNWMITSLEDAKKNISGDWHRDNVGHRLKVFICFVGDKSQPTSIVPKTHLLKNSIFSKEVLFESIRWSGFGFKKNFKNEFYIKHKEGSCFIFDTNLFHRGVYENATLDRKILYLEFSMKQKSESINGPIGPDKNNWFTFTKEILDLECFNRMLDIDLINFDEDKQIYYYGKLSKNSN